MVCTLIMGVRADFERVGYHSCQRNLAASQGVVAARAEAGRLRPSTSLEDTEVRKHPKSAHSDRVFTVVTAQELEISPFDQGNRIMDEAVGLTARV